MNDNIIKKNGTLRGRRNPSNASATGSYLVDETVRMDRERRLAEQKGHAQFTKVNAREHPENEEKQYLKGIYKIVFYNTQSLIIRDLMVLILI